MSMLADRLTKLLPLPKLDGSSNMIRKLWDVVSSMPGGKLVFSRLVGRMAPYTGTIDARINVLRSGYCEATMADRHAVRNHLNSIHAIALCNLAEIAGNVALFYSMPDDARFIVSGIDIEYLKKARGTITAIGESPIPRTNARAPFDVSVTLRDARGETVAKATLHSLIGPKPGSGGSGERGDVN
ncbi:MAG TPA: hotdog fold domain-containing protein [Kofleriaceae bacterium]